MSEKPLIPHKAVVLAAGMGRRLRPMTLFLPKPLIPLGGEPLIERSLRQLESWGVTEIAVNLHWQAAILRDYLTARSGRAKICCSYEPQLLGTAGALHAFRDFIAGEPFWIVNADIVWDLAPEPLLQKWQRAQPLATLWLLPDKGPRTVETDDEGRITTFRSSRRGQTGTATFSGVQIASPLVLDYLPVDVSRVVSLVDLYEAALQDGQEVVGVMSAECSYRWDDAGTVPDYLRLRNKHLRKDDAILSYPVGVPFHCNQAREICYNAAAWPDPVLAPLLSGTPFVLSQTSVTPLKARGSDRSFLRVDCGQKSAIYIRYGTQRDENFRYGTHARFLHEAGVAVPQVIKESRVARALLLEDIGRVSLGDALTANPDAAEPLYQQALEPVLRLHTVATKLVCKRGLKMEPGFDHRLYAWERDLFLNQIVRGRHANDAVISAGVIKDYERVAAELLAVTERVIVHRDLQSTNIITNHKRMSLIDFQGMRYGAAAYDLASLLCDPYVALSAQLRDRLLAHYAGRVGPMLGAETVRLFPYGAVQRLTQALGAYGRLTNLNLTGWQQYIIPAAQLLAEMAEMCGLSHIRELALVTIESERVRD